MDKVLPILEKYVQWIALGFGALFLLFMAYSYAVKQPVLIDVAGTPTVPGEVDSTIENSSSHKQLQSIITKDIGIENPPKVQPVSGAVFTDKMDLNPPIPNPRNDQTITPSSTPVIAATDVQIPLVPKATFVASRAGRGVYQYQKPVPPPPTVNGLPGANPEAAPAFVPQAAPVEMITRDMDWASTKFTVSVKSLSDAFKAAKLPNPDLEMLVSKTAFLGVEVIRQEKAVDGTWGPETVVPPLPLYGPLLKPLPKPTANPSEKSEFRLWAAQPMNVAMMLQPAFPQAIAGEPWTEPLPPVAPGAAPVPNAVNGEVIPPPGFGGEGAGMGMAPGTIPGTDNPDGIFNPQALAEQSALMGVPDPKVTIYAHDIDVVAGKTYRYRLSYFIRNPLFLAPGVKKQDQLNTLVLASEKSEWTSEITISPRIEFWVNKVIPGRGTPDEAEFNVFVDKGGRWEPVTVRVFPGDPIARGESDSGWSLVDIRKSKANKYYVLVTDTNGKMQRREVEIDANDPRQQQLKGVPDVPPGSETTPPINEGGVRPPARPVPTPPRRTPGFTVTPE